MNPIIFGESHCMCIKVASSTAKLCCKRYIRKQLKLIIEPLSKHHYFFSQNCWRSGLPMCMCEHRNSLPFLCKLVNSSSKFFYKRQVFFFDILLPAKRNSGVINIL